MITVTLSPTERDDLVMALVTAHRWNETLLDAYRGCTGEGDRILATQKREENRRWEELRRKIQIAR